MNKYELEKLLEQLSNHDIYVRDSDGALLEIVEVATVLGDDKHIVLVVE